MKTLARNLLAFYGARLPYHKGKWRVVDLLHEKLNLAPPHPETPVPVRRQDLDWGLRFDCCIQRAVFYLGVYEREETRWITRFLQPGMSVLDIGSNFGYYSLLAAREVGAEGQVVAFEPYTPNRVQLEANLVRNGFESWVQVEDCALSDSPGSLSFVVPPDSCLGVGHLATDADVKGRKVDVPVTTLDAYAQESGLQGLDFIKLDVEGAEARVLAGGEETLRRFQPVMLVEINPDGLRQFDCEPAVLVDRLTSLGYSLHRVRGGDLVPIHLDASTDFDAVFGDHGNTIAIPRAQGGGS